jgi:hypothetical protein
MGFWHVRERPHRLSVPDICNLVPTDKERFHAALAYSRPVGNMDPDRDPSFALSATAEGRAPTVVSCPAQ